MKDWFARAIDDPDSLVDRVEEADFVTAVPGDALPLAGTCTTAAGPAQS